MTWTLRDYGLYVTMDLHDVLLRMRESRPALLLTLCFIQFLVLGHDSVFILNPIQE